MIHGHGSHGTYRAVPVRLFCSARGLSRRLGEKPFSSEMDGIKPLEFMVNHPQMESKWKPKKMGWWLGLPRKKHVYHIWLWIIYVYMSIQDRFLDLCGFVNAPRTWIFPWSQSDVNTLRQYLSYDWDCPPMHKRTTNNWPSSKNCMECCPWTRATYFFASAYHMLRLEHCNTCWQGVELKLG